MKNKKLWFSGILILLFLIIALPFLRKNICIQNYFNPTSSTTLSDSFTKKAELYYMGLSLIVNALILWFYFKSHKDIMNQNNQINKENNSPTISLKFISTLDGYIYLKIYNSGNGPAYDIAIDFEKIIKYGDSEYSILNNLPMFKKLSVLERKEEHKIFISNSKDFHNQNKRDIPIKISYYLKPSYKRNKDIGYDQEYYSVLGVDELKGILYVSENGIHDLTNEISELKELLILSLLKERKS